MKLYFKQAWNLLKQEKLFSSIYVIGTGLSISLVMILSIVGYIRMANIYPETNRDRMLVVKSGMERKTRNSSALSLKTIETCFRPLESAEAIGIIMSVWGSDDYVQTIGEEEQVPVSVNYVDDGFWKVFSFRFLEGKPFTKEDLQSGIQTAVISKSLARKLFGREDVIGEYVSLNFSSYRVCGVVKDVSFVTETTYANLWVPYTVNLEWENNWGGNSGALGYMKCYILAPSVRDVEKVRKEAYGNIQRYAQTFGEDIDFTVNGQPDRYWESTFRFASNSEPDFTKILIKYVVIFLILLLVPAVSLSGMTDSRMDRRLAEMGVRRAFGAPVHVLMRQVLSENFLFTLLGGALGLLFSYLFILFSADWIVQIGQQFIDVPPEGTLVVFTPSMLINIPVFLIALGVCFLLNLFTALIPAWKSSHKEIVYSLNRKD